MPDIGKQLAEVPIDQMILNLALGIAKAQNALDQNSVQTIRTFNKEKIQIGTQSKSLLECGLLPSFYFFSEATIDVQVSMSMRSEESTTIGVEASASKEGSVAVAASLNFENTRKFEFSAEGSSSISVRLVTVPPPAQLLAFIESTPETPPS